MKTTILLLAMALVLPFQLRAEELKVSLKEAINLALAENHMLKAATYEHVAAEKDVWASRSRYLPRLYLEETAASSNAPTRVFMMKLDEARFTSNDFQIDNLNHPRSRSDFRTALTVEQTLFDMTVGSNVDQAKFEEAARRFALERRREEVAFRVFTAYLEVQRAKAQLAAAENGAATAREHMRLAKVRNEAGVGLKSDELRSRAFLSEMEQQQLAAINDLHLAQLRLALATGSGSGAGLDIAEELKAAELAMGNEDLVKLAMENRQDLKEMEQGVAKAGSGLKTARNAFLPTIYGSATYQMNDQNTPFGRDNDSWMVGATLRWELFDGLRRWNDHGKASALKNSADEYLERYRQEIAYQVTESYLRREEAGKRLEIASNTLLDAEEGHRLVERRFENSISTMVELLDAQTALNRARARLVDNQSNYALATGQLYHAAGIFLKEVMQ